MSKKPKQSGVQTTTQQGTLPPWLDSRFQDLAGAAQTQYETQADQPNRYSYYDFNPVAPFSDASNQGMSNMLTTSYSGVPDNALQNWNATLQGDYLKGGQGFDAAFNAASNRITPQVTSAFNSAGRMGGGAGQAELTRQLGDSFAGLYDNERQRQMGALSMAPQMNQLAYDPAMRQLQVGAMRDSKANEEMAAKMARFDFGQKNQDYEANALDQYLARLSGMAPNFRGQQSQTPIYKSGGGLGSILGAGLSIAGMATGNPWLGMAATGAGLLGGGGGGMGVSSTPNNSMYAPSGGFQGGMW